MKKFLLGLLLSLAALRAFGAVTMLAGPAINVTAATNATPIVVTVASAHGLAINDWVLIRGVQGNTNANGYWQCSAVAGGNTCTLSGSVGNAAYTVGGTMVAQGVVAITAGSYFDIAKCDKAYVMIFSPGGAVASVNIEASPQPGGGAPTNVTTPNFVLQTVTNPTASGTYYSIPVMSSVRVNVTAWTSGTVYAYLEGFRAGARVW